VWWRAATVPSDSASVSTSGGGGGLASAFEDELRRPAGAARPRRDWGDKIDPPDEVWAARAPLTPPFATAANGSEAASEVYRESG